MKMLLKMQKRNIVFSSDRSWICTGKEKMAAFNNIKITNQNSVRFVFRKCKQKKMRNHRDLLELNPLIQIVEVWLSWCLRHHSFTPSRTHRRSSASAKGHVTKSNTVACLIHKACKYLRILAPSASTSHLYRLICYSFLWLRWWSCSIGLFSDLSRVFYVSRQEKFIGNIFSCTFCSSIHLFCPAIFASFFVNANEQIILAVACINFGPALHKCWNKIIDYSIFIQKQCGRHWIQILCTSHKRVPQNTPQKSMVYDATVKWEKNLQNY